MRAWMMLGFSFAAGLAALVFLGEDGILSAEEAARVVGGEVFPNSKCIQAGTCDELNSRLIISCPSWNGYCKGCGNGGSPIYGCRGNYPGSTCWYTETVDCGELWEGICNFNACTLMAPTGTSCEDGSECEDN